MQPDYLKQIGGRIRFLRTGARMTQEDLAERATINPNYLGRIERGEINVTIQTLTAIAEGLRVSLFDIIRPAKTEPDAAQLRRDTQRLLHQIDTPALAILKELMDQYRVKRGR